MITLQVLEFDEYCRRHGISCYYYASGNQPGEEDTVSFNHKFRSLRCHVHPDYISLYNENREFVTFHHVNKILVDEPGNDMVRYTCKVVCDGVSGKNIVYIIRMD